MHRAATFSSRLMLMALAMVLLPSLPASAVEPSPEQQFQLALEAQSARDYPAMLGWLRQAARAGDVEAQEMLGMVLIAAPVLYGASVRADRCEALVWLRRAAEGGSDVAQYQVHLLNRLRTAPASASAC